MANQFSSEQIVSLSFNLFEIILISIIFKV